MPTNDERREVAARLRKTEIEDLGFGLGSSAHLGEAIGECVRLVSGHDCLVDAGLNRLADLIEPEPICIANLTFTAEQQDEVFQRVMKEMQAKKQTLVLYENEAEVCHECGEPLPDYANFCPNCGAKVVE